MKKEGKQERGRPETTWRRCTIVGELKQQHHNRAGERWRKWPATEGSDSS